MVERKSLRKTGVVYEGIFSVSEIFSIIREFFRTKSYDWFERLNEEIVDQNGRQVVIKVLPYKKTSDYTKNVVKVVVQLLNLTDVVVEIDGEKKNMQKGTAKISIEAYIETDYEGTHSNYPVYFFMREFFDRYIYRIYTRKAESLSLDDAEHLRVLLKQYFNIHEAS